MVAGETKTKTIVLRNGEAYTFGTLSGSTATLYVYSFFDFDAKPDVQKNAQVIAASDNSACSVSLRLLSSNTANLCGKYIYMIKLTDASGNVHKPRGILYIAKGEPE